MPAAVRPLNDRPASMLVRVLDHDPDLGEGLSPADRDLARRFALARAERHPAGPWRPRTGGCLCGLVLHGLVAREVTAAGTVSAELLGPGDVIAPVTGRQGDFVPTSVEWFVVEPVEVAWLGARFEQALRRWPELNRALFQRLGEATGRAGFTQNLAQLTRVDERVLMLLWHLAERFGRVTPDGVVLPLRLTHRMIGRLVGARRPSVTTAFATLERSGAIERRGDGAIVLHRRPEEPLVHAAENRAPWLLRSSREVVLDDLRVPGRGQRTTSADGKSASL